MGELIIERAKEKGRCPNRKGGGSGGERASNLRVMGGLDKEGGKEKKLSWGEKKVAERFFISSRRKDLFFFVKRKREVGMNYEVVKKGLSPLGGRLSEDIMFFTSKRKKGGKEG